jgi:hypothetical protein
MKSIFSLITACAVFSASLFATCATTTINGQCIFTDVAPTISACGTSPSASSTSNSNGGTILVGTSPTNINSGNNSGIPTKVTQCTLTFATAFTAAPTVMVQTDQLGLAATVLSVSTTAVTIGFSKEAATHHFYYTAF